jgi:hypothetical protein
MIRAIRPPRPMPHIMPPSIICCIMVASKPRPMDSACEPRKPTMARAWRYKPSTTLLSLACTSFATSARPGLSIACMEATGSTAETSTLPP